MSDASARWLDLGTRILSASVMTAVTLAALWYSPAAWAVYALLIYCVMIWELSALCDPAVNGRLRIGLAVLPLISLPGLHALGASFGYVTGFAALAVPLVAGLAVLGQRRLLWLGYGATLAIATLFLIYANDRYGMTGVIVLIALVAVSDTAGYFAGRAFGGPKFWPAISPKKTWSGTLAGWVFTAIFGYFAFPLIGVAPVMGAVLSVVLGFSAQLGDIAESAMKRRAGIKDSSNLLPGHGGVLDRLDGLIAAACVAGVMALAAGG